MVIQYRAIEGIWSRLVFHRLFFFLALRSPIFFTRCCCCHYYTTHSLTHSLTRCSVEEMIRVKDKAKKDKEKVRIGIGGESVEGASGGRRQTPGEIRIQSGECVSDCVSE
jgi:hypothetical protein